MEMARKVLYLLFLFAVGVITTTSYVIEDDAFCKSEVLAEAAKEYSGYMNKSVKPCDNFYQFVCAKSSIDANTIARKRINAFSKKFLGEKLESNYDLKDAKNKARLHYQMCMDMETRRKRGVEPFLEYVKAVLGFDVLKQEFVVEEFDWLESLATIAQIGQQGIFAAYYDRDEIRLYKDTALTAFNKSEVENVLIETGLETTLAGSTAEEILEFGVHLDSSGKDSLPPVSETLTFQELQSKIPDIDWERYFQIADGHPPSQRISMYPSSYFYSLRKKLDQASPKSIANYMFFVVFQTAYITLDGRYNEVFQNLANAYGKKYDPDPESWCISMPSYWIEDAISSVYVKEHFGGRAKTEVMELIEFLRKAVADHHWPDPKSKDLVSQSIARIKFELGFPDYLLSDELVNERYKDLEIIPGKYFESQQNAMKHKRRLAEKRFNSTDPTWNMWPLATSINTGKNSIIGVPAGKLQPPFYHHCYPKAMTFGAVGTLIASKIIREIEGNMSCSSTKSSQSVPGTESLHFAYKAYTNWVKEKQPVEDLGLPELEHVNDKQLFFMAYAHSWCGSSESNIEQRIRDALSNMTEFSTVFHCPVGSNMNPTSSKINCTFN